MKRHDLYNPILHRFKDDPTERATHPDNYDYDVYYDNDNRVEYFFYRSGSYGYLFDVIYDDEFRVSKTIIHPVLAGNFDRNADTLSNTFFYQHGKLKIYKNQLSDHLLIIEGEDTWLYKGVLTGSNDFLVSKIPIQDYYIKFL